MPADDTPENHPMPSVADNDNSAAPATMGSNHSASRWLLQTKVSIFRFLMSIGMHLHHIPSPRPPSHDFSIEIPRRIAIQKGSFKLIFYVPKEYHEQKSARRFPCVINYHGGGFALGTGTDDARWAKYVIEEVGAVLCSVEYGLAPEFPFSTAVEDATDAVIYIAAHADELRIDPHNLALSGFSAGANLAFTVPLLLHDLQNNVGKRSIRPVLATAPSTSSVGKIYKPSYKSGKDLITTEEREQVDPETSVVSLEHISVETSKLIEQLTIKAIVSFYPPTDYRVSREEKRQTNVKPDHNLSPVLTDMFDRSYIYPPNEVFPGDPYLSPAAASDQILKAAYPQNIILYTCEYDMLNAEGVVFGDRLRSEPIGKNVKGGLIEAVPHAFDKSPNPFSFSPSAIKAYQECCAELSTIFGSKKSFEERTQLDQQKKVERFDPAQKHLGKDSGSGSNHDVHHKFSVTGSEPFAGPEPSSQQTKMH